MASTYTPAGIELIADGEQANTWGQTTNTNWELIEELATGVVSVALTSTSYTLTTTDGVSSTGRHAIIKFTGSPGGTCTVTVSPNDMQKIYWVVNASDQTVTITQGSGTSISVPADSKKVMYCDGAGAGAAVVDLTNDLDISFQDNDKLTFGASDDLEIYHNGTDSYISDVGTGTLCLTSDGSGINLQKSTSEYLARFYTDGAAELYYDNAKKFETYADGVSVTGDLRVNGELDFTTGTGTSNFIDYKGGLLIRSQESTPGAFEYSITATKDAGVELYYDGTKTFETVSGGAKVTGDLEVTGDVIGLGTMASQNANNVQITGGKVDVTTETASGYGMRVRRAPSSGSATLQFTDNTAASQLATIIHDGTNLWLSADTGRVVLSDDVGVTKTLSLNESGTTGSTVLSLRHGGDLRLYAADDSSYVDVYCDSSNNITMGQGGGNATIRAGGLLGDWVWNGSVMVGQVGAKMWDTSYGISPSLGGTVAGSAFTGTAQVGTWQFLNADYNGTANLWYFWVQRIA